MDVLRERDWQGQTQGGRVGWDRQKHKKINTGCTGTKLDGKLSSLVAAAAATLVVVFVVDDDVAVVATVMMM